ncbi:phage major capsid protein, P2 family [Sphingomonas hylomeconis]|uniref:Phage major capsid protein, P2 family n=1 Tax=Sphingomonas hylomeconis TaxID=1395958 RepID=A0ABV7SWC4_9SPHN|nr:phage major capsid protein, P2 family [Sphingomonas hylomeconis]
MRNSTRLLYNAYVSQIALLSGVPDATTQFSVAPVVEQKLIERVMTSSDFLSKIGNVTVTQQEGDKVGIGVTRPIASRTNTAGGNRRTPTDPTDTSDLGRYRCEQTNSDTAIKYAKLDAWAHRPEFQTLVRDAIIKQKGRDRIMIGWNGIAVAAQSDLDANPLLQDINKGWLYKIRTFADSRWLRDGALTTGALAATKAIYVDDTGVPFNHAQGADNTGANVDFVNLDALAFEAVELIDEWHRDDTDLVVIVGRDLLHDKYFSIVNAAGDKATEMLARDVIMSTKQIGGMPAVRVPFFPANAMLITTLANLAIYTQEGTTRRQLKDEPALDQIENYESVNEAYVVEDYGLTALVENIVMGKKPA